MRVWEGSRRAAVRALIREGEITREAIEKYLYAGSKKTEVLCLLAEGIHTEDIAKDLDIAERTVKLYIDYAIADLVLKILTKRD